MKNFARIIALICAVILLVPCFASCANTQGAEDTTASQNAQTQAPDEEVTVDNSKDKDGYLRDDIPDELDYKGEVVSILGWEDVERPEFEILEDETGIDMVKDAISKLQAPAVPQFSIAAVVILSVSVLLKLWLSYFNRTLGRRIDSEVMRATSADALSDAIATSAVLITTLIAPLLPERIGMYIDPVMGLIVAALIFVAGARILNDTKNSILGTKPDEETVKTICEVVERFPEAIGIHDMVVHNYGPCRTLATLHVEVDGKKDIFLSHDAIDNIERVLREEYGIECSIHLDPIVVDDPLVEEWRERTQQLAHVIDERIMLHDFRVVPGTSHTNLLFDMAVPFEITESDEELKRKMAMAVAAVSPNFYTVITVDRV